MRRVFASLLVALFSFSLIAPAVFASDSDSKLPACCRRDGKHHCSLMAKAASQSGPALRSGPCVYFPTARATPASQFSGLPGVSRAILTGVQVGPASFCRPESLSRISYSQAGQKRGPPASSL